MTPKSSNSLIEAIYSRRVTRYFSARPITRQDLETIVEAGRWSPSGGNRRLQRFVVVTQERHIQLMRLMSPGLDGVPAAIIVICTDHQERERQGYPPDAAGQFLDVGMAGENMLLAAHALGIGAGPVTSFSKAAVTEITKLPDWLSPDLFICLGYPHEKPVGGNVRPKKPVRWQDITHWEQYDADNSSGT